MFSEQTAGRKTETKIQPGKERTTKRVVQKVFQGLYFSTPVRSLERSKVLVGKGSVVGPMVRGGGVLGSVGGHAKPLETAIVRRINLTGLDIVSPLVYHETSNNY